MKKRRKSTSYSTSENFELQKQPYVQNYSYYGVSKSACIKRINTSKFLFPPVFSYVSVVGMLLDELAKP